MIKDEVITVNILDDETRKLANMVGREMCKLIDSLDIKERPLFEYLVLYSAIFSNVMSWAFSSLVDDNIENPFDILEKSLAVINKNTKEEFQVYLSEKK